MSPEDLPDEELVALCQNGEGRYFEVLVRRYMEKACRIALDFTHNTEEAKDLSQDAFLWAFSRIDELSAGTSLFTWLYRSVLYVCLWHARRHERECGALPL